MLLQPQTVGYIYKEKVPSNYRDMYLLNGYLAVEFLSRIGILEDEKSSTQVKESIKAMRQRIDNYVKNT